MNNEKPTATPKFHGQKQWQRPDSARPVPNFQAIIDKSNQPLTTRPVLPEIKEAPSHGK